MHMTPFPKWLVVTPFSLSAILTKDLEGNACVAKVTNSSLIDLRTFLMLAIFGCASIYYLSRLGL